MIPVDLVMTYVDERDKAWSHDYLVWSRIEKIKYEKNNVRFRSWDNFNYILRSAAQYLPFINNVYLIVSSETQIPEFLNTDNVHIVYHKDIIPEEYLPTFNSNAIEMFMYRIPGLSEHFIYMNDDMLFLKECSIEDYYDNDMNPLIAISEKAMLKKNIYTLSLQKTMRLANVENSRFRLNWPKHLLRSDHAPNPMKVSLWKYYWDKYNYEMSDSITRFREAKNITQELSNYHYFMYYKTHNMNCFSKRVNRYFDFANNKDSDYLSEILNNSNIMTSCINDAGVVDFPVYRNVVNKLLQKRFPEKCRFEK